MCFECFQTVIKYLCLSYVICYVLYVFTTIRTHSEHSTNSLVTFNCACFHIVIVYNKSLCCQPFSHRMLNYAPTICHHSLFCHSLASNRQDSLFFFRSQTSRIFFRSKTSRIFFRSQTCHRQESRIFFRSQTCHRQDSMMCQCSSSRTCLSGRALVHYFM